MHRGGGGRCCRSLEKKAEGEDGLAFYRGFELGVKGGLLKRGLQKNLRATFCMGGKGKVLKGIIKGGKVSEWLIPSEPWLLMQRGMHLPSQPPPQPQTLHFSFVGKKRVLPCQKRGC